MEDMKVSEGNMKEMEEDVVKEAEKRPIHPVLWQLMLLSGVVIYGGYTIMVHLCEVDGKLPFSSASLILNTEIVKLCLSLTMLVPEFRKNKIELPTFWQALPFAVPAALYCFTNNISVHMQLQMDPATYQVLGNLKILSTAFLYKLIIKRPITGVQWLALVLLAMAGACNSYGGLTSTPGSNSAGIVHITVKGLLMMSCYCFVSGFSGVFTEYIFKNKYEMPLNLQNALLYVFGIILNGLGWFYWSYTSNEPGRLSLYHGYSVYTWVLVFTQATVGLIMSVIFKHGNNITRLFVISCAMLVTTILSMIIFNLQLSLFFCIAFVLVFISLSLYHKT